MEELKKIIAVSGLGGLFKVIAQTKDRFIIESFADKKRTAISASYKVSTLSDISVYTDSGDVPLGDVLKKMKDKEAESAPVDPKSEPAVLRNYFKAVLPDFDQERVYNSDIKKIVSWYGILKEVLTFEEPEGKKENAEEEVSTKKEKREVKAEEKASAKTPKKKAPAAKKTIAKSKDNENVSKKKTAPKKSISAKKAK